jgi:hypothetical protein
MQSIEVRRKNGKYPLDLLRKAIQTYGIVLLKGLLPKETQAPLRRILEGKVGEGRRQAAVLEQTDFPKADFLLGDVLAVRELEPFRFVFFQPEVLEAVKGILEATELVYWGDSSIQFGEAARGFHKDNTNRNDGLHDDWTRNYELVRCGFYLQDHVHHSGGLKVRLRSHNIPNHLGGRMADMPIEYGDLAIWNMRLTHSGNNKRLRLPVKVPLHPRIEAVLPNFMAAPEQARRIAAFCSFGKAGTHLDSYIDKMNAREKDYKPYFQFARKPAEAEHLLSQWAVKFRQPNSYYGEFD